MKEKVKNETLRILTHAQKMRYRLVVEGAAVGFLAGGVAVLYRLALQNAEALMRWVLALIQGVPWMIALWFVLLAAMGLVCAFLVRLEPLISGSGIPQVEGELIGFIDQRWSRVLPAKIAGGILCIFGGLSLGREGPSIQLGAMTGKGLSRLLERTRTEENHIITCGASAGLSAAFNAPLAGIVFALEEIHKSFSTTILFSVMTASVAADFLSKHIFGLAPVFHFPVEHSIPLNDYWLLLVLGVLLGLLGAVYNKTILATQGLFDRAKRIPPGFQMMIPFLTAGVLGFFCPQVLGSGHGMIDLLTEGNLALSAVFLLLVLKFFFSVLSFGSGAPGGIFFPLLVLGAFIGGMFGMAASRWLGVSPDLVNNFIILAMAGYFTAIVRAPITGIVLVSEMTGSLNHLLSLSVVGITAYVTADFLRVAPIYESLLGRVLRRQDVKLSTSGEEKVLIHQVVQQGSKAANNKISGVKWPEECLVVSVKRGREELIPKGSTLLLPGDTIFVLADTQQAGHVREQLREVCSDPL